ncbi:RagB/SusD family nutrient uptake outer membrane protein [Hymenobacter defluvii]|uniref:RagB/SusD family nutrient uptake outer membrane protein n=1 Tax=Hymenobacter defluvii TaxID=2054411 RepID=A0ABS3TIH4_9BACT|nr:RagB/SusD family nutrient uptake outer membrane protein [Hymenobacter defluvii]MBO3273462.1 RagB/SusD family nutrient uptake outer membrane protein [Hymenobacter defluvii]
MSIFSFHQFATRSALLLSLGLAVGACDKAIDVEPRNAVSSSTGYATKEDAAAGLLGAYDAVQSTDYQGVGYSSMVELIAGNITHVGTYNTTYGYAGQNLLLPDNVQISNTWNIIYDGINRVNYLLEQSENITDPAFPKLTTQGEARALRAYHYMNLLSAWGGSENGYGYDGGAGVPLRLTATTAVGEQTAPIARASEADVAAAIRADLDFAITNLTGNSGTRITRNAALALRARFELQMRKYEDALKYAKQVVSVPTDFAGAALTGTTAPDAIWQVAFSNTDQNFYAFYWYPSPGGRNEFNPGQSLVSAHPAGDKRLAINAATSPAGTTLKYTRTATRDDPFNAVRYAEVVLTIAEAAARTGDLATATTQLNVIRKRAGLANTQATTANDLVADILLQRRLELAYEGIYWFDLRRTNTVQQALPTYTQTFRNLFPLPQREVNLSNKLTAQNTGY